MTLLVLLLVVVPVSGLVGWFVAAPLLGGHPPLTMPAMSVLVEHYKPDLKRRWPPYSKGERMAAIKAQRDYLGPFAWR